QHVVEALPILRPKRARAPAELDAAPPRRRLRASVGRLTGVVGGGAGAVDLDPIAQALSLEQMPHDTLCSGRAADVPEAHEAHFDGRWRRGHPAVLSWWFARARLVRRGRWRVAGARAGA